MKELETLRALHRGLADMISQGRLSAADLPDDFDWLQAKLSAVTSDDRRTTDDDLIIVLNASMQWLETRTAALAQEDDPAASLRIERDVEQLDEARSRLSFAPGTALSATHVHRIEPAQPNDSDGSAPDVSASATASQGPIQWHERALALAEALGAYMGESFGERSDDHDPVSTAIDRLNDLALQRELGFAPKLSSDRVLSSQWPDGLEAGTFYEVACDDRGRNGGTWLRVFISPADGDAHVMAQNWEDMPEGEPDPNVQIRLRTRAGGGRASRTRQALLWLAEAIRLDASDDCPTTRRL